MQVIQGRWNVCSTNRNQLLSAGVGRQGGLRARHLAGVQAGGQGGPLQSAGGEDGDGDGGHNADDDDGAGELLGQGGAVVPRAGECHPDQDHQHPHLRGDRNLYWVEWGWGSANPLYESLHYICKSLAHGWL